MRRIPRVAIWISAAAAYLACGVLLAPAQDPGEDVEVITEAENVPNEASNAPRETQTLPLEGPETSGRAFLGVDLDKQYPDAAIITRVYRGTPAAAAGLRPGDRIWAIDNQPVESIVGLITLIAQMQPGRRIEISYSRPRTVQVALGRRDQPATLRSSGSGAIDASAAANAAPAGAVRDPQNRPRAAAESPRDEDDSGGENQPTATTSDAHP